MPRSGCYGVLQVRRVDQMPRLPVPGLIITFDGTATGPGAVDGLVSRAIGGKEAGNKHYNCFTLIIDMATSNLQMPEIARPNLRSQLATQQWVQVRISLRVIVACAATSTAVPCTPLLLFLLWALRLPLRLWYVYLVPLTASTPRA